MRTEGNQRKSGVDREVVVSSKAQRWVWCTAQQRVIFLKLEFSPSAASRPEVCLSRCRSCCSALAKRDIGHFARRKVLQG